MWGNGSDGSLGTGPANANPSSPVQIGSLTNWASIKAGNSHNISLKTDGTLWAWGQGNNGKLGDNTTVNKSSPVQIGSETAWTKALAGDSNSVALINTAS